MIDRWQRIGDAMADAVVAVQVKTQHIKNANENLLLVLTWMKAYGELALLSAEDLSVYVHWRHCFQPHLYWKIDDLTNMVATTGLVSTKLTWDNFLCPGEYLRPLQHHLVMLVLHHNAIPHEKRDSLVAFARLVQACMYSLKRSARVRGCCGPAIACATARERTSINEYAWLRVANCELGLLPSALKSRWTFCWCTLLMVRWKEEARHCKTSYLPSTTLLLPHPLHRKQFLHWLSLQLADTKLEDYYLLRFQYKAQLGHLQSEFQVVPDNLSSLQQQTFSHSKQQLPVHCWSADLEPLQTIQRIYWLIAAHLLNLHLMVH